MIRLIRVPVYWMSVLMCFLMACSTDIELEASGEDVVVVYGALSMQDTAHYVRVERAFKARGGDANALAQQPDNLYFDPISVQLERLSTGQRFTLERVSGAAEGFPREAGPFAMVPNYLYKIGADVIDLQEGETIRLLVDRNADLPLTTAEAQILPPLGVRNNSPFSPVNMAYDRQITFAWGYGDGTAIFDVRLRIHWSENGIPKSADWVLTTSLRPDDTAGRASLTVLGEQFYRFLAETLENEPTVPRVFEGMTLLVVGGGEALAEALDVAQANVGLTSAQVIPRFSNINQGEGVFTSRAYLERSNLVLNGPSLDSLRNGQITRNLLFR